RQGCATCGRPLASPAPAGFRCGSCRRRPPPFDRLCCAYCYRPPLDAVLTALKFRRLDYLGSQLGRALARRLAAAGGGLPEVVVPVPLHWWRFLRRGYNQAALIARPLAEQFGVPMETLLRRRRATPPQSRLAREARLRNPRGAFALRRGARCAGRRVLLVDDVMTTGATLAAAAVCLRRAGAREIIAAAAARAPLAG
ncbi:MAG: ComF family protein, partial [Acidobacteria bacterium]